MCIRDRLNKAASKYKENLCFSVTKVALLTDTKQQFLHCPLKAVVDLGKTHADPLLAGTCGVTNLQAQPPMTLNQIQELTVYQRFDVTALVAGVDNNPRDVTPNRKVIDVRLLDASGPGGKAQEVKVSFFYNHPPDAATRATMDILRESSNEALSFFALQGKRTDSGFSVETSRDFFLLKAVGLRAAELNAAAAELHGTTQDQRECLPVHSFASGGDQNYAEQTATESFCKILSGLAGATNIKELETGTTVWQLSLIHI